MAGSTPLPGINLVESVENDPLLRWSLELLLRKMIAEPHFVDRNSLL
jgi:hypothetical protein